MKIRTFIISLAALLTFGTLIVFLISYFNTQNMGVLNPQGVIALAEKNLLITVFGLMMIVIVPVFCMLFFFMWKYREGNKRAHYDPDWNNSLILEWIWWLVPAVIVVILGVITWKSTHELDPYRPLVSNAKPVIVQVVALNWKWLFIYPEERIATVNYLHIPKDTSINFTITADAPMNAFWIPQLGGQIYAMPGMSTKLHLMATKEGEYQGLSSNYSGEGFAGMKFITKVTDTKDYVEWLNTLRTSPSVLSYDEYTELAKSSMNNPVVWYSYVPEDMYTRIIEKYMKHDPDMHGSPSSKQPTVNSIQKMHAH